MPSSSSEKKKLDESITTVGNLQYALHGESPGLQLYMQHADETPLIEITEVIKVLSKKKDEEPYIVLRCI